MPREVVYQRAEGSWAYPLNRDTLSIVLRTGSEVTACHVRYGECPGR